MKGSMQKKKIKILSMHQFSSHISQKITSITKKMTSNNVNTTHNMFLG
jgi:hypothetical protein